MVQQESPQAVVVEVKKHGFIVRALYYIFIGWWFGLLWALLSWLVYATVIGAPLGAVMLNKVPGMISLKQRDKRYNVVSTGGGHDVVEEKPQQRRWWIRVIYYPFGLIFSLIAIFVGWLLCVFIITLPLGIIIFNKVPAIASLHRG
jgi:uncharacterized membrane protein YccF (DUF307 family)